MYFIISSGIPATTYISPTVTPRRIVSLAPIQAFFLIWTLFNSNLWRSDAFKGWLTEISLAKGPIRTVSSIFIPQGLSLEFLYQYKPVFRKQYGDQNQYQKASKLSLTDQSDFESSPQSVHAPNPRFELVYWCCTKGRFMLLNPSNYSTQATCFWYQFLYIKLI